MSTMQNNTALSLLKALGSPVRLDILKNLTDGEMCVCTILKQLKLSQNLVSHHLAILRENDLIIARKEGKWVHYSLNSARFTQLKVFIEDFASGKNSKSNC